MSITYRVIITGLSNGFSLTQVKGNLATLFKTTVDKLPDIFGQSTFVVKKNIDLDTAKKYQLLIQQQGCECVVEPEQDIDLSFDDSSESTIIPVVESNIKESVNLDSTSNKQTISKSKEFKFCNNCGFQLPVNAKFCRSCGSSQVKVAKNPNQSSNDSKQVNLTVSETKKRETLEPTPPSSLSNSSEFHNQVGIKKSLKTKVLATCIFVAVVAGITFAIWTSNKSSKNSQSKIPVANQPQTAITDSSKTDYHEMSSDTVAGKFTIKSFNDSSTHHQVLLNGNEIENCGQQSCSQDFFSINVNKAFNIDGKTVLFMEYGDGGNLCEGFFGFFTISKDGSYQSTDSDIGNCASLSGGSVVQAGAKIILTLPTLEQNMVGTEVWTYEKGKVTGPIKTIKPEFNVNIDTIQKITASQNEVDLHSIITGNVIKKGDGYYLKFDKPIMIVNPTGYHDGGIVDELAIDLNDNTGNELVPKLGNGKFDAVMSCSRPYCSISVKDATLGSATESAIPKQFQGIWSDASGCKNYKAGIEFDPGAEITSNRVVRYEHDCELVKIIASSATTLSAEFTCSQDGETTNENISLILQPDGRLAGISSNLLPMCK
jgi:ribosomal protein L40E